MADGCEIASGAAQDCNANGVPDTCDIADCAGDPACSDCDDNGALDACDLLPHGYALDDGGAETGIGMGADPSDIMWLNQFTVEPGISFISSVGVYWWGPQAGGAAAEIVVWDDLNNDGDPSDAVVLSTTPTTSAVSVETVTPIAPVYVGSPGDSFFVGVVMAQAPNEFPAALDTSSVYQGSSWWVAGPLGTGDINDLPSNAEFGTTGSLGVSGNWLVRAAGEADCNGNGLPDACDIATCGGDSACSDCNLNGLPDGCDIASGVFADLDGDGKPDVCDCWITAAPAQDVIAAKPRYLSFENGTPGLLQAMRVTFTDLPAPHHGYNGTTWWVGPPSLVTENSGGTGHVSGYADLSMATLQCDPYYADWSANGVVHVYHEGIVSGALYAVQSITDGCLTVNEGAYSAALDVTMSRWGDVAGPFDGGTQTWTAPDGVVGVPTDIVAIIDKFANLPTAPSKTRADLEPETPNRLINIGDTIKALDAFRGAQYPWIIGTFPCK